MSPILKQLLETIRNHVPHSQKVCWKLYETTYPILKKLFGNYTKPRFLFSKRCLKLYETTSPILPIAYISIWRQGNPRIARDGWEEYENDVTRVLSLDSDAKENNYNFKNKSWRHFTCNDVKYPSQVPFCVVGQLNSMQSLPRTPSFFVHTGWVVEWLERSPCS